MFTSVGFFALKANNGRRPHLVLQRHDGIVFGRIDVQHVEAVLPAEVVGDVGEGRAGRLGHSVVDDDRVFALGRRRQFPPGGVFAVTLLHFGHLVSGDSAFCAGPKE